ncbi:unnamed protein product [Tuber melanosporum]|uniref:(Perigord truffle) hypothetical protein n=1 Tax=Tuber melanosporum (strain Mel28) TaxID=656061 RepID=D5GG93_TUBMM|nr:uncharacterized protein GSTUM_00007269001 [Tuber melanosporum]CAZ83536.1 unnamed protein product [Tuber melanosporum]
MSRYFRLPSLHLLSLCSVIRFLNLRSYFYFVQNACTPGNRSDGDASELPAHDQNLGSSETLVLPVITHITNPLCVWLRSWLRRENLFYGSGHDKSTHPAIVQPALEREELTAESRDVEKLFLEAASYLPIPPDTYPISKHYHGLNTASQNLHYGRKLPTGNDLSGNPTGKWRPTRAITVAAPKLRGPLHKRNR